MEIDTSSLSTPQGQLSLGVQKKSLEVQADMTNQLVQGSLEAANSARASQGIGTNLNITI